MKAIGYIRGNKQEAPHRPEPVSGGSMQRRSGLLSDLARTLSIRALERFDLLASLVPGDAGEGAYCASRWLAPGHNMFFQLRIRIAKSTAWRFPLATRTFVLCS